MDEGPRAKKPRMMTATTTAQSFVTTSGGAMFQMPSQGSINLKIANGSIHSVTSASLPIALQLTSHPYSESHPIVAMATGSGQLSQSESGKPSPEQSSKLASVALDKMRKRKRTNEDEEASGRGTDGGDSDLGAGLVWKNGIGTLPGSDMKFRMNEFGAIELVMDEPEMPSLSPVERISPNGAATSETPMMEQACCLNCGKFGLTNQFVCKGKYCTSKCWTTFNERTSLLPPKITAQKQQPTSSQQPQRIVPAPNPNSASAAATHSPKPSPVKDEPSIVGKILAKKKRPAESMKNDNRAATDAADAEVAKTMALGKKKGFSWALYLDSEKLMAAPVKCFKTPFPLNRNAFKVGMRLEGLDPRNASLYTVLTVAEVRGFRLRLHFDGYPDCYDFWENADSPNLFHAGWCEKNSKKLLPPKGSKPHNIYIEFVMKKNIVMNVSFFPIGFTPETFNWAQYLKTTKAQPAPRNLLQTRNATSVTPHGFRVGMKLEAIDRKNTSLICVATVADTISDRILIHFDGWEDCFDYWVDTSSPYIKPVGFCQENERPLSTPKDYGDIASFTWQDYLRQTKSSPVPARAFKPRSPMAFEVGMRVEVVDKRNPILIRVASVCEVNDYQVKIHFDGWSDLYDYWIDDDSSDVHPPGWCAKTGHPLVPPISPADLAVSPSQGGCPTPGCKGIGHIRGAKYTGHHSAFGCPYSAMNLNKESVLMDRLTAVKVEGSPSSKQSSPDTNSQSGTAKSTPSKVSDITPIKKVKQRPGRPRKKPFKPFPTLQNGGTTSLHNGVHESVFQTAVLQAPVKDGALPWEYHAKLLPGIDHISSSQVAKWDMEDVAKFVSSLPGCDDHGRTFQEEQIDGEAFLLLEQADIVKIMNIKLGPALKIYNSIQMFKRNGLET